MLVIGETEAEVILTKSTNDAILDVELPVKEAGVDGSGGRHQQRKIRDLVIQPPPLPLH